MKDPAFLFYPGDYLRDTQCLSEKSQVAYDRIMCEHMRNICISQQQLNFFTKRLSDEEKAELLFLLTQTDGGYQITWVAESICKRREYSNSRRNNRTKSKKTSDEDVLTYDQHMENENEDENTNVLKGGMGENSSIPFDDFWNLYDKKRGDKGKLSRRWDKMSAKDKEAIMAYIPAYKDATPDKQYRKDPQTFFNNRSWEDELITSKKETITQEQKREDHVHE